MTWRSGAVFEEVKSPGRLEGILSSPDVIWCHKIPCWEEPLRKFENADIISICFKVRFV